MEIPLERYGFCQGCGAHSVTLYRMLPGLYRYRCQVCFEKPEEKAAALDMAREIAQHKGEWR